MIEITAYKTPKIIFISHVCTGTMTQEALKAQIQQLEQERDTLLIELQTASLQLQRAPVDVNKAYANGYSQRKKRDQERMACFNKKKEEEAKRREEEAGWQREQELSLHELTGCVGELVEVMRLLRKSHLDLHEKIDRLFYCENCSCQGYADSGEETETEGKDLRKNDESTAADPAPADV